MKKLWAATAWLLLLGVAYWLGASTRPGGEPTPTVSATSFDAALDSGDPLTRSFEISRFLRGIETERMDALTEAVEAEGYWFDRQEHRLLLAAWVPIDPDAASLWAFSRPGLLQDRAAEAAVEALGYFNPAHARYFLQSMEDQDQADSLHLNMVMGWARSDRKDALSGYLAAQPSSVYRQNAVAALANEILRQGPDELIEWVEEIDDEPATFKRAAFQKGAHALAQLYPVRAASWLEEHLGRPYALRAPNVVARSWAEKDPAAAMSWLLSLPDASTEEDRAKPMFTQWLSRDPKSAESWIRAEPPSEARDPLIRIVIRRDFERRPALSIEWAHLLHDPIVRTRVQTSAGRSWYRRDPEAFLAWLPNGGLDQQVRDLILNTPMRHGKRAGDNANQEPIRLEHGTEPSTPEPDAEEG